MKLKSDFSGCPEKAAVRKKNLEWVRASDHGPKALRRDWVELCGGGKDGSKLLGDETFHMLLTEGMLTPGGGRYIGISNNADVIAANEEIYSKETKEGLCLWFLCDWDTALQDSAIIGRASIFVYDSYQAVWNTRLAADLHETFMATSNKEPASCCEFGDVIVIITVTGAHKSGEVNAESIRKLQGRLKDAYGHPDDEDTQPQRYRSKVAPMLVFRIKHG